MADGTGSEVTINTEAQLGGIVSVFGGNGNDTFTAGAAYSATSVTLVGNDGADSLTSSTAADLVLGGTGNDTINGGGGADNLGSLVVDSDLDKVDLVEALEFTAGGDCNSDLDIEARLALQAIPRRPQQGNPPSIRHVRRREHQGPQATCD